MERKYLDKWIGIVRLSQTYSRKSEGQNRHYHVAVLGNVRV